MSIAEESTVEREKGCIFCGYLDSCSKEGNIVCPEYQAIATGETRYQGEFGGITWWGYISGVDEIVLAAVNPATKPVGEFAPIDDQKSWRGGRLLGTVVKPSDVGTKAAIESVAGRGPIEPRKRDA